MSVQLAIGINLFTSPQDNTQAEFLSLLEGATKSIHIADYSFNIAAVAQILVDKAKAGLDVKVVLDYTQSRGKTEQASISLLKGCPQVKMRIVESSLGQIMHDKTTTIDGHITETGSWNYTISASKENNNFLVFDDTLITNDFNVWAAYDASFMDMFDGQTTKVKYSQG